VRHPASARLRNAGAVKRQLLLLVTAVVVVDLCFIAGYFIFDLNTGGNPARIGYAAAWTVVTLLVVLRFLTRIRSLRGR